MKDLVVILDNIRSTHNVGSILRTCDGLGVKRVITCGTTPYPNLANDDRLPHVSLRAHKQIAKTALGAENTVEVEHFDSTKEAIDKLRTLGYEVWAVEQTSKSVDLDDLSVVPNKLAIIFGNEVGGVDTSLNYDQALEIRMKGQKESFNVSVSAGIVIYRLTRK